MLYWEHWNKGQCDCQLHPQVNTSIQIITFCPKSEKNPACLLVRYRKLVSELTERYLRDMEDSSANMANKEDLENFRNSVMNVIKCGAFECP